MSILILHRRSSSSKRLADFQKVGIAKNILEARHRISNSQTMADTGDIIVACDMSISKDVRLSATDAWIIDFSGTLKKVPALPRIYGDGNTWLNFWESKNSVASDMLDLSSRFIDNKSLTIAACACARTTTKYVPDGETRLSSALEKAELWTVGMTTSSDVKHSAELALSSDADPSTIQSVVSAALTHENGRYAFMSAYFAEELADENGEDVAALAAIVRHFIPLEKLLLSVIGK